MKDKINQHTLVILAFNQTLPSGLIGIADMLALAQISQTHSPRNKITTYKEHSEMSWCPKVLTASLDGKAVIDGQGRSFEPDVAIKDIEYCDAILIPGFVPSADGVPPKNITDRVCRDWIRLQFNQGALIGGSCSGAFVIGEAGLLNQRRCTTTWWLHYELTKRFPQASTAWASPLVQDGQVITSGGPLSWVDICLRTIRDLAGHEVANRVADFAVVDTMPNTQNKYIPQGHLMSADPFLIEAENLIRQNRKNPLSTVALASELAVSERTLHRRLKKITGESPKSFIDRVRMDMAKTMLHTSDQPINHIAFDLGYSDDAVFRRLFRKQLGMSPSEFRHWKKNRNV